MSRAKTGTGSLSLVLFISCLASSEQPKPFPKRICEAKSVLIKAHEAQTYFRAVAEIKRTGRWKVAEAKADNPDLILEFVSGGVWKGGIKLFVRDARTGEEFWRDRQRTLFWRDTTKSLMRRLEKRCPEWKRPE